MSNEKMRIIKMIEDKIVTVEEGLKLIEALKLEEAENQVTKEETKAEEESVVIIEKKNPVDDLDEEEVSIIIEKENEKVKDESVNVEEEKDFAEDVKQGFKDSFESLDDLGEQIGKTIGEIGKIFESKLGSIKKDLDDNKNREQMQKNYKIPYENVKDINVSLVAGNVDIVTEDRDDIRIEAKGYQLSNGDDFLTVEIENGILNVKNNKARDKGVLAQLVNNTREVALDLYLPDSYKGGLTMKGVSVDYDIRNIDLDFVKINTVSGDIDANEIFANGVIINTTSGDVEIASAKGDIKIMSVSGDVDINVEALMDELEVKTVSGDIEVALPEKEMFSLSMKTLSGDLECDFQLDELKVSKKSKIDAVVGMEGKNVTLASTSGDIELNKA
eukprot:TRINITY_DN1198_c0_g1_i1.p2 TRINITY_DN1198_c0_g1~~TRINITY_DN1198_c0_g1_i1.p2  ORF type:complete len:388 (-),score=102.92 TRINITY_DN1198_c0_g1_i1:503-1666(-)